MPLFCAEKENCFTTERSRGIISDSRKLGNQMLKYNRSAINGEPIVILDRLDVLEAGQKPCILLELQRWWQITMNHITLVNPLLAGVGKFKIEKPRKRVIETPNEHSFHPKTNWTLNYF